MIGYILRHVGHTRLMSGSIAEESYRKNKRHMYSTDMKAVDKKAIRK